MGRLGSSRDSFVQGALIALLMIPTGALQIALLKVPKGALGIPLPRIPGHGSFPLAILRLFHSGQTYDPQGSSRDSIANDSTCFTDLASKVSTPHFASEKHTLFRVSSS